jgi:uncharacterized OB-fold protein
MNANGQPTIVRGTQLDAASLKRGLNLTSYTPQLRYTWDTGVAIGRYLAELKNGRLIARACRTCERVMIPPRMFCERCFRPTDEWVELQSTGTVNTFSLCYVSWDVRRLRSPEIPAVIEIDGASPGMGILHIIRKVSPKRVHVGMRVTAVWKPKSQRTGSITDITYWAPLRAPKKSIASSKSEIRNKR